MRDKPVVATKLPYVVNPNSYYEANSGSSEAGNVIFFELPWIETRRL